MKLFKQLFLAAALLASALTAQAAGTQTNIQIAHISSYDNGHVYIAFAASTVGGPACGSANHGFSFDATTPSGSAMAAAAFTAYTTQALILATGTGACTADGTWETLHSIYFE